MRKTKRKNSKVKEIIINHINNNIKSYFTLSLVFIAGVIIGVMCINNTKLQQKQELTEYITEFVNLLKGDEYKVDTIRYLRSSIFRNLKLCIIIWFTSSTVIGIFAVYSITMYKGFCMRIYYRINDINIWYRKRSFNINDSNAYAKYYFGTSYFCYKCKWSEIV